MRTELSTRLFEIHFVAYWASVYYFNSKPSVKGSLSLMKMLPLVLFNQIVVTSFVLLSLENLIELPNTVSVYAPVQMLAVLFMNNCLFGTFHWICHKNKYLFNNVHYIHHRLKITTGAGAVYAHPLEHMFVNLSPLIIGVIAFRPDIYSLQLLILLVTIETVHGHHAFSEKKSSKHKYHHMYSVYNFDNSPYFMDKWIFNSYYEPNN